METITSGQSWAATLPMRSIVATVVIVAMVARRVPWVGATLRFGLTLVLLGVVALLVVQRSRTDPQFARLAGGLNLDGQRISGKELRVHMASDGHFWVHATINGVARRMLVDSGATVTAISTDTAEAAGVDVGRPLMPVVLQTANGTVEAGTATLPRLRIGNVVARGLPVVVSPAFGDMDVLGMNFLSRLKGWRVEGATLILTPHHPTPSTAAAVSQTETG